MTAALESTTLDGKPVISGLLLADCPLIPGGASGRLAVPLSHPTHDGPVPYIPYSLWAEKSPVCCGSTVSGSPAFAHTLELLMMTTGLLGH